MCDRNSENFAEKSFLKWAVLGRCSLVVRTVALLLQVISIYRLRASGPWWLVSWRLDLNCDTCLMDERVRTKMHVVRMMTAIFPYLCFGKKSWNFGRTLSVIWTGCWIVQTDASWSSSKLLNIEEGLDGNPRRPDGWCFGQMGVWMVRNSKNFAENLSWNEPCSDGGPLSFGRSHFCCK
jgi:hypothetical protein